MSQKTWYPDTFMNTEITNYQFWDSGHYWHLLIWAWQKDGYMNIMSIYYSGDMYIQNYPENISKILFLFIQTMNMTWIENNFPGWGVHGTLAWPWCDSGDPAPCTIYSSFSEKKHTKEETNTKSQLKFQLEIPENFVEVFTFFKKKFERHQITEQNLHRLLTVTIYHELSI